MIEENALLVETTDRLLRDLASKSGPWADTPEHWTLLEDQALPDLLVSPDHGGFGGTWADANAVFFATGFHGSALPLAETIIAKRLLSQSLASRSGACPVSLTAPGARLIAYPGKTPHAFSGHLPAVSSAAAGSIVVTSADGADGEWIVALDVKHARNTGRCASFGDAALQLTFEDAPILHAAPSAPELPSLKHILAAMRTAQIAGAMLAILNMTQRYVSDRRQFGRSLSSFQAIQHQLAVMAEETVAVSYAAAFAFSALQSTRAEFEIAAAKLRAARAVPLVVSIAHQLHGAIGFTAEYPLHLFTQRLRRWRVEFGGDAYWARTLGQLVLAQSQGDLWAFLTKHFDSAMSRPHASERGHRGYRETEKAISAQGG